MNIKLTFIFILLINLNACNNRSESKTDTQPIQIVEDKQDLYQQLKSAIETGDEIAFSLLIKEIPCLDSLIQDNRTENSYTLLGYACKYKRCNMAEGIINLQADIEIGETDEFFVYDALSVAVESQDTCLVKLLLNKGANPNRWYNEDGFTALSLSCRLNNYTISKLLVENGAKVNGEGDTGTDYIHYPLLHAVENNNLELIKLLIDNGAKIDIRDKQDETPFTIADRIQNEEISDLLLENLQLQKTHELYQ